LVASRKPPPLSFSQIDSNKRTAVKSSTV